MSAPDASRTSWVEITAGDGPGLRIETQVIASSEPDAPVLVFLHEGLGSVSMWRDFPQRLCAAGNFAGLIYSRPGYGRSTPRPAHDRWTPSFMHVQAQDVLPRVLAATGIDPVRSRVWLFGHSDGGSIALLHAALPDARTRGVVVLAPHLFVEELSVTSIAKAREAYHHTDLRARLSRHHDDVDSAFYGWNDIWLDPAFRDWSIQAEVAQIQCPILAIQGVDDEYGTLAQIDRIAELVPGTQLLKLPNCGHSPHRDQAQAVIDATVTFIREHG